VKQRIRPMLGFKRFDHAAVTTRGIELAEKIKKGQFKTGALGGSESDHVGTVECCAGRLMPSAISSLSGAEANLTCARICTRATIYSNS
jgi:hypothetical protein